MPGLVPGIRVLLALRRRVDGRDKPGHDDVVSMRTRSHKNAPPGGGKTGRGLMSDFTARASLIEMARRTSS
jgi:hypothetical protein